MCFGVLDGSCVTVVVVVSIIIVVSGFIDCLSVVTVIHVVGIKVDSVGGTLLGRVDIFTVAGAKVGDCTVVSCLVVGVKDVGSKVVISVM